MNTVTKATLVTVLFSVLITSSFSALGMAYADNANRGPPDNWEAHPPIHVKGNSGNVKPLTAITQTQVTQAYGIVGLGCKLNQNDGLTTSYCGTGQTIVIIDAYDDPKIQSDLATFSSTFSLPACTTANGCFTKLTPQGTPPKNSGWALEESLDVEWAHAIAPGAKIILVEARSASFSNLFGAINYVNTNNLGGQVSMSWGGNEFSGETSYDKYFTKAGVGYFASSGDTGGAIIYPSASPNVVSVGGTTLNVDSSGNVISETAWSGSGGGQSAYESSPQYQSGFGLTYTQRATPDVSYDADPYTGFPVYDTVSYFGQTGWFQVGGTSAGAPQWAAISAIANSQRTSSSMSVPDITLYGAATASYAANYRDITSGTAGSFSAGPSYDLVTGLGSPLANNLVTYLASH